MHNKRKTPLEIPKEEFRAIGYELIDAISDFLATIKARPVTTGESAQQIQELLGAASLPEKGSPPRDLMSHATDLLLNHSLLNGHPKFLGYITSSAAPIAALAELLAASVNPNVGAQILSPMATEIENQTIQWLAELIGLPPEYGGILVSGGNMANFTAFLAARTEMAPKSIREEGITNFPSKLLVYCSKTTHTWIEKAVILFGLGTQSIRWIETDARNKINIRILEETISTDLANGHQPIMVIGTAGDVSTGVVDDLNAIAAVCKKYQLWFHIDGAYGIAAAVLPELQSMFLGLKEADSIALDPHKWLYSPLEAGCTLVKNSQHLLNTYSSHPEYYNFSTDQEKQEHNYYEYGLQNSRGFRALKVWLALQQVGRKGYAEMIAEDIRLSQKMFDLARRHPELEAITQNLSISTFRYIPADLTNDDYTKEGYLNDLNKALLNKLQEKGEVFLSNAIVHDKYCLRACIVNFRTTEKDIEEIMEIIIREGRELHERLKE